ncbi:MAG TPA: hypothetical protein VMT67_15390 [Terriglobales bacterium]|nr:hypothetical protein [Terriglobales bacterium]
MAAAWGLMLFVLFACQAGGAENARVAAEAADHRNPIELVRKAVQNELKANQGVAEHFMFRGVKTTPKGSTTKLYAETKEGSAGLIIAYDGKSLTPDQAKGEEARLQRFIDNPEELRKKRAQEREDAEHTTRIMRALPDAFLYEDAGEEKGTEGIGRAGDPLVKLKFRPNPNYTPPSRVEEVLTGMQGHILVDAIHFRIASIDGTLFKPVGFGWGILGHLDKGGRFVVHQQDVNNVWEISSMTLHFDGKILLVKSLHIDSTEVYSGFKRVPNDLTFAQAVQLLKKEEATVATEKSASENVAEKQKR